MSRLPYFSIISLSFSLSLSLSHSLSLSLSHSHTHTYTHTYTLSLVTVTLSICWSASQRVGGDQGHAKIVIMGMHVEYREMLLELYASFWCWQKLKERNGLLCVSGD